jgi:hypothetical protein
MYYKVVHYSLIQCISPSNLTCLATYCHRNLRSIVCIIWPIVPTCQKILLLALPTVAFVLSQITRDITAIWIEANLAVAGEFGWPSTLALLPPDLVIVTHFVLFCSARGLVEIWIAVKCSVVCGSWKLKVESWRLEVGSWSGVMSAPYIDIKTASPFIHPTSNVSFTSIQRFWARIVNHIVWMLPWTWVYTYLDSAAFFISLNLFPTARAADISPRHRASFDMQLDLQDKNTFKPSYLLTSIVGVVQHVLLPR